MLNKKLLMQHIDLKRPQWIRPYLDKTIDQLSKWGFNSILFEFEDKFRFKNYPTLAHRDAPSRAETIDFVESCHKKGLDVIPLIQCLGHAESIVGRSEFAHLRESPELTEQYDATSEEARRFICELCDDVIDALRPREYLHLGGDETWTLGTSARCRPIAQSIGLGKLYLGHVLPILEHVARRGLRPIIWSDMILSYPEIIPSIPKYTVIMDWNYRVRDMRGPQLHIHGGGECDPQTGHRPTIWSMSWDEMLRYDNPAFKKHFEHLAIDTQSKQDGTFNLFYGTDALLEAGLDVITASASRSFGDSMGIPENGSHLPNCFVSSRVGNQKCGGTVVTSWAVRHCHPELTYIGTFAAVHALKDQRPFDTKNLYAAFTKDFFGIEIPEFEQAVHMAQSILSVSESCNAEGFQRLLKNHQDPIPQVIKKMELKYGSNAEALENVASARKGYGEALDLFRAMKPIKNTHHLDYWIEGVQLQLLYADFASAALNRTLPAAAGELIGKISRLEEQTRPLFADTYTSHGVEEEIWSRYGYWREYLKRMGN